MSNGGKLRSGRRATAGRKLGPRTVTETLAASAAHPTGAPQWARVAPFRDPEDSLSYLLWQLYHGWMRRLNGALAGVAMTHLQFIVLGLTRGILRATSAANIAELRREGRDVGLASGVYNAGLDIGGIIGPALGGAVATVVGIPQMFQVVALTSLVAWLLVALATPASRDAAGFSKRHTIGPTETSTSSRGERIG